MKPFRRILRLLLKFLLGILAFFVLYVIIALVLPIFSVNSSDKNPKEDVSIYIKSNGVHTDVVVPIKTQYKDWSEKIQYKHIKSANSTLQFIAFGWGDKGFYLDTPTWADLKFSTAFKAAFWLSESAMHCSFYNEMNEADDCKKIMISERQYRDLVKFVDAKFEKDAKGNYIFIKTDAVYADNDAFYDANGTYSFAYTCNTWSNDALKAAGQKSAYWTASDYGIFLHYK